MKIFLSVVAQNWAGTHQSCWFEARGVDDLPLPLTGGSDDAAPVYEIPAIAGEMKLIVKIQPTNAGAMFWDTTVSLMVGATGLTVKSDFEGFVQLTTRQAGPDHQANLARVIVSRFKDVTAATLALLSNPPATRNRFRFVGDANPNTGVKYTKKDWYDEANTQEIDGLPRRWKKWPPDDWDLEDLAAAHFIDPTSPVTSSNSLNFVRDQLEINVKSVVLELAGVDAPKLFGVAWPDSVPRETGAKPTPFLLFIEQSLKGNLYDADGLFARPALAPYPYNFDYAYMLYQQLHYAGISQPVGSWKVEPTPLVLSEMKGVPYQVARAGAKVVTVVPMNSFDKEYGVMDKNIDEMGGILEELQAFMFMSAKVAPPASVGKTAIAAFSSGTRILYKWLASEANRKGKFLKDTVRAVYFLDPPLDPKKPDYDVNTFINAALQWATQGTDKRIRLYNRDHSEAHAKLLGKATPSAPYVRNSSNGLNTAAELPTKHWVAVLGPAGPQLIGTSPKAQFAFAHHMFAATMLTHALSQNDLS